MSAVWHGRHVCCFTEQTCLPCHAADMPPVCHSRHACLVTQQTCLLLQAHDRRACCVTQQTYLLCHNADTCRDIRQEASLKRKWSPPIPYKHDKRRRSAFTPCWPRPLWNTHEHKRDTNFMNEMCEKRLYCTLHQISRHLRCRAFPVYIYIYMCIYVAISHRPLSFSAMCMCSCVAG